MSQWFDRPKPVAGCRFSAPPVRAKRSYPVNEGLVRSLKAGIWRGNGLIRPHNRKEQDQMSGSASDDVWAEPRPTALLVLADGTVLEGFGLGATGHAVGEVCFNTAMTGYQEVLTDPSYAGQIITFTFPHIGNVGTNEEDIETISMAGASGVRCHHHQAMATMTATTAHLRKLMHVFPLRPTRASSAAAMQDRA